MSIILFRNRKKWSESGFTPLSFIDVIFLLLIFFFLTATKKENPVPPNWCNVPYADIDSKIKTDNIKGIRLLIQRCTDEPRRFEYYLLGYDNEDRDPNRNNITERNLDVARNWMGHLEVDGQIDEDKILIDEYHEHIVTGDNIVRRYGIVPDRCIERKREQARIALFIRFVEKEYSQFFQSSIFKIEIKADESAPIGFITDVMKICGDASIPRVSFILKNRVIVGNAEG